MSTHKLTNNGLKISLPCIPLDENRLLAILNCEVEPGFGVGIWLEKFGSGTYRRLPGSRLAKLSEAEEEEAEMISMYLSIENVLKQCTDSSLSSMAIKSILGDSKCEIRRITLSSQQFINARPGWPIPDHHGSELFEKNQLRYLFHELCLHDNEAVHFALTKSGPNLVGVTAGLRQGEPKLLFVKARQLYDINWLEVMRLSEEDWDLAGDFDQMLLCSDHILFQMEAKKSQSNEQRSCKWNVVITILNCLCGAVEESGNDCICTTRGRDLRTLEGTIETNDCECDSCDRMQDLRMESMETDEAGTCQCMDCESLRLQTWTCDERGRTAANIGRPEQRIGCECDGCLVAWGPFFWFKGKEPIRDSHGTHYVECPCRACVRNGKIVVSPFRSAECEDDTCILSSIAALFRDESTVT